MTTPGLFRPPPWTRRSLCAGHPDGPAPWDAETETARQVCADCPVRADCVLEALHNAIPHGMWGGLTTSERRAIARQHGYELPGAAQHGTRSRYVSGCRCDLCRNAHRIYEHDRRLRVRLAVAPLILDRRQGRGRRAAYPGQVLLFALPARPVATPAADTPHLRIAA